MATHIKFMQGIIYKPIFVLKKDYDNVRAGRRSSTLVPSISDAYISDIVSESIVDFSNPSKSITLRRIFVTTTETQSTGYNQVGWALNDDISTCMLCKGQFGVRTYPHHCKACGNLFCQNCANNKVVIATLDKLGPLRACNMCYYGQEVVDFCPNRPQPPKKIIDMKPQAQMQTQEDQLRQMKLLQQQEFQKEALARIQQNPSLSSTLLPPAKKFTSVTPVEDINNGGMSTPMVTNPMLVNRSAPSSEKLSSNGSSARESFSYRDRPSLSVGTMSVVVPNVGFVLKTKRNNGTKIFINICSHETVPYKPERSKSVAELDEKKPIYMILNIPLEYQNEKDQSICIIYDVIVNPEELIFSSNDQSGAVKHRLCCQTLEMISMNYKERVDPQYVILRLATNYKGRDDGGKVSVRPCYMPPREAFMASPQIVASPIPLTHGMSLQNEVSNSPMSQRESMSRLERQSTFSTENIFNTFGANPQGIQRLLKAIVVPREEIDKLMERNFNPILEAINSYEVEMKEVVLYPEAGFVVLAQQIKPVRKIYINVCHHPAVGIKTPEIDSISTETGILKPCPFILGQVNYSTGDNALTGKAMIIDIVIPSSIMILVISDQTGNLRDELAIEILQRLSSLNVILDSNFALPIVPGGYVPPTPSPVIKIPPVINLTEEEKASYVVCYIGKLFKQGHRYKTWKERLIFFAESRMQYFDLKMAYQGEFEIEECSLKDLTTEECSAPNTSFAFQIKNHASGGEFMNCYVQNVQYKDLLTLLFEIKLHHIEALKILINIPSMKTGFLKKQGHVVKNWKMRYFLLNYGVLSYYENNNTEKNGVKETPKGKVVLKNAVVAVVLTDEVTGKQLSATDFRLQVVDQENNKLLMQMKNSQERKEWFDAIKKHIEYAKEYLD